MDAGETGAESGSRLDELYQKQLGLTAAVRRALEDVSTAQRTAGLREQQYRDAFRTGEEEVRRAAAAGDVSSAQAQSEQQGELLNRLNDAVVELRVLRDLEARLTAQARGLHQAVDELRTTKRRQRPRWS